LRDLKVVRRLLRRGDPKPHAADVSLRIVSWPVEKDVPLPTRMIGNDAVHQRSRYVIEISSHPRGRSLASCRPVSTSLALAGVRLDGQNLLNHKKAATTKVAVASKEITLWRALFQASEEAANQV